MSGELLLTGVTVSRECSSNSLSVVNPCSPAYARTLLAVVLTPHFLVSFKEAGMQEAGLIKVECFDAKSGRALGSFKVRPRDDGRIHVPSLEKAFNATRGLLLVAPDGILIDTIGDGYSYCTFSPGSTVRMYRWRLEDVMGSAPVFEFSWPSWPSFLRFQQHAQGKLAPCVTATASLCAPAILTDLYEHDVGHNKKSD